MQKLQLTKRPAKIGKSVNTRTEMHGKDEVPGQDIPITGIVLTAEELCAVTDEETAATGFFKMDGDQYVPRILALNPGTLGHKFSDDDDDHRRPPRPPKPSPIRPSGADVARDLVKDVKTEVPDTEESLQR